MRHGIKLQNIIIITSVLDIIIELYKPHDLNLCEANIKTNLHKIQNDFDNYKIEVTKQSNFTKFSRSCLMIHDNVDYIRRYDLEDDETSNVWIEIKNKSKILLVMGVIDNGNYQKFINCLHLKIQINKNLDLLKLWTNGKKP